LRTASALPMAPCTSREYVLATTNVRGPLPAPTASTSVAAVSTLPDADDTDTDAAVSVSANTLESAPAHCAWTRCTDRSPPQRGLTSSVSPSVRPARSPPRMAFLAVGGVGTVSRFLAVLGISSDHARCSRGCAGPWMCWTARFDEGQFASEV